MIKIRSFILGLIAFLVVIISAGILGYFFAHLIITDSFSAIRACSYSVTKGGSFPNMLLISFVFGLIAFVRIIYPKKIKITAYPSEPLVFVVTAVIIFSLALMDTFRCESIIHFLPFI